jgi:hypothetical protein
MECEPLAAALLPELPLPVTLVLETSGVAGTVTVATHVTCSSATFGVAKWLAMIAHPNPFGPSLLVNAEIQAGFSPRARKPNHIGPPNPPWPVRLVARCRDRWLGTEHHSRRIRS